MGLVHSTPEEARAVRTKSGLTQPVFAQAMGVTKITVLRWEKVGMPGAEYHYARMLFDDEYATRWISKQVGKRERLRLLVLRRLKKDK